LVQLAHVAAQLGVTPARLLELAQAGELPPELRVGQLLVEEVRPPGPGLAPEQLVAGTTRQRARVAQGVALQHYFDRLNEPVVPQRSI